MKKTTDHEETQGPLDGEKEIIEASGATIETGDETTKKQDDSSNERKSDNNEDEITNSAQMEKLMSEIETLKETFARELGSLNEQMKNAADEKSGMIRDFRETIRRKDTSLLLRSIASEAGFISPEEAELFLSGKITHTPDSTHINGKKVIEKNLPGNLEEIIQQLSTDKPHLVRPNWRKGTGAQPSDREEERADDRFDFNNPSDRKRFEEKLREKGLPLLNPIK